MPENHIYFGSVFGEPLTAKVKAHLRREERKSPEAIKERNTVSFNELEIDNLARTVNFKSKSVLLSTIEFDLLWYLANHPGEIKSREDIFNNIKGIEYNGQSRAVDIHVSQIRSKLSKISNNNQWIKTVRGYGYILNYDTNIF